MTPDDDRADFRLTVHLNVARTGLTDDKLEEIVGVALSLLSAKSGEVIVTIDGTEVACHSFDKDV